MEILKYLLILSLPIIALFISKKYSAFVDSILERARGYYLFLCHIERMLGSYLTPPHRLGDGFSHPSLDDMMMRISAGDSLIDAYRACRGSLPSSVDETLTEFFSDFGKGDVSLELRRVREAISRIDAALSVEGAEGEKQKKICSVIAPSLAIGLVIWMI